MSNKTPLLKHSIQVATKLKTRGEDSAASTSELKYNKKPDKEDQINKHNNITNKVNNCGDFNDNNMMRINKRRVSKVIQDMASGDHKSIEVPDLPKDASKIDSILSSPPKTYKNTFQEDQRIRPVVCPVASCNKMVAVDSLSSHFSFDHFKVPIKYLEKLVPQEIYLNASAITTEPQCLAVFLRQHNIARCDDITLLMACKIQAPHSKLSERYLTKYPNPKFVTQDYEKFDFNLSTININNKTNQISINDTQKRDKDYSDDESMLLWLCGLHNQTVYTVILSKNDQKLSFGYTGTSISIREEQNPLSIYNKAECLLVRGKAVNSLIGNNNRVKVIVNFVY